MWFEIVGPITNIEIIAIGSAIRDLPRLRQKFGHGRWRKLKGTATVMLADHTLRLAELHWYEASGIGRHRMKIKQFLD